MFGEFPFGGGYFGEGPVVTPVVFTTGFSTGASASETRTAGMGSETSMAGAADGESSHTGVAAAQTKIVPASVGRTRDERSGA